MCVLVCSQHNEAESICNILPPQEPKEAFQCPLTHQEEDHVFPPVQGAPPEVQREVHAHPQRWRSPGIVVWNADSHNRYEKCKVRLLDLLLLFANRLSVDTTKASRSAKWCRSTGRSTSSTLSVCRERRPTEPQSMSASTPARWGSRVDPQVPDSVEKKCVKVNVVARLL